MSDCNKNRVLALYNILSKYTDIHHQMSMKEIVARMELNGYPCSEDSILRYMKQLRQELNVDFTVPSAFGLSFGFTGRAGIIAVP